MLTHLTCSTLGTDWAEGHVMETSIRLDAGAYGIRAQRAVSRTSISFRIDQLAPRRPRRTVVLDLAALRDYAS